ncbi:MAG: NACHT domain-containing protein, partial [Bacteroidota bacterium]
MLIGEPSVGKTTLCQRIAQQWAQGHAHSGFAAVYLLDAADLQDQKALATAIAHKYFATASTTAVDLQQQVKQIRAQLTTGKSLIILDALEQTSGLGHPLVQEALQSRAHVLVTDHPWGAQDKYCELLLNSDTLWLACQGLDQEQVNQYVYHQYLGDGKRAQALLAFLDNSPVAEDLHIPANLRLFFQCWRIGKDALKRLGKDSSKTMYYRTAAELVRKKHMPTASDLNVMLGRAALSRHTVGKAGPQPVERCLEAFMQQLGIEDQKDQKELLNSLRESELLSPASPVDKRLTFRNPMLRAYLSGRELARQLLSVGERKVAQQWLQEHQYDPRHRATLTFMAGELGIQGHTAGVKIMLDALGTLAEQQVGDLPLLRLQLHCLSEAAESSKQVDVKLIEKTYKLQKKLLQWVGRALNKIEEDKYAEYGPLHEELLRFFPEIKHLLRDNRTCYELYTMVYYSLLKKEQEGTFVRGAARSFDNTLSASFEGLCEV